VLAYLVIRHLYSNFAHYWRYWSPNDI